jgi:hypothetical protein
MSGIRYFSEVLNQKGAPALYEDLIDNIPAATFEGRLFFATDVVSGDTIFRDNGDGTWSALAGNGGGGISLATNGLGIYDDIAIGLGGILTQPETIIEGNTFLWRTASLNDNTQGFNLNFDSQVYSFGVIENEELHSYIEFGDSYIQNVVSDDNNATYLTQFHSINEFYLDIGVIVGEEIFNWNPFFASPSYTYIRHNNTDFESEAYNTIQGQFKITANAENFTLHYNFINIPAYANNAAALAANLVVGDIYRSSTGGGDTLHIVH